MTASSSDRIVKAADSAASSSSGDNVLKSKAMRSSVTGWWTDYAKFATNARYTRHSGLSRRAVDTPEAARKIDPKPNTVSYQEWLRVGPVDATATSSRFAGVRC